MDTDDERGPHMRPVSIIFLNCGTAKVFAETVSLTVAEEARLRVLLSALEGFGALLLPTAATTGHSDLAGVMGHLRRTVGEHIVATALASPEPAPRDPPVAVMPVWAFEPESGSEDVLVSSANLWGTDLWVEALRVEDDDNPTPLASVRDRHERWTAAACPGRLPRAARLAGREGSFALFAVAAPA